jgi:cytochrome c oxidase assembly factor CtaG
MVSLGTILVQLPPVVGSISDGGPLTALALTALLVGAIAFWSMVMRPAPRVTGIGAAGYVIIGGLPISMPAMLLILVPGDVYGEFHANGAALVDGHLDQLIAGFILFAAVKVVIFTVASMIFVQASREVPAEDDEDDDGGRPVPQAPPGVPGWVRELVRDPLPDEPAPALPEREKEPARV